MNGVANSETYEQFTEKFKPKRTTDDCYTPKNVYDAIADWAAKEYGLDKNNFVRPFYPGGDYENFAYGKESVVVDNPPFSILQKIVKFYQERGIKFFLFAPGLTVFTALCVEGVCAIITNSTITYDNGAKVNTAFLTNMEKDCVVRCIPDLQNIIKDEDRRNRDRMVKEKPKYQYPGNVISGAILQKIAPYSTFCVRRSEALFVRSLDSQQKEGKIIFGGGLLLSDSAAKRWAAAKEAATKEAVIWELSDREKNIIAKL